MCVFCKLAVLPVAPSRDAVGKTADARALDLCPARRRASQKYRLVDGPSPWHGERLVKRDESS